MFIKIVIVLLLLIVAASLLTGRGTAGQQAAPRPISQVRPLMLRVAIALLLLCTTLVLFHFLG